MGEIIKTKDWKDIIQARKEGYDVHIASDSNREYSEMELEEQHRMDNPFIPKPYKLDEFITENQQYNTKVIDGLCSNLDFPTSYDVYFCGNAKRGKEIISILQNKYDGSNPNNLQGNVYRYPNVLYFVNNMGIITAVEESGILGRLLKRYYKEEKLPPIETIEYNGKKYEKSKFLDGIKNAEIE